MRLYEIYEYLDSISPFELQEEWDNSGINIGNLETNIKTVYVMLEVSFESLRQVEPNSLIITHHPLLFKSSKSFITNVYPYNVVSEMLKRNISLISMHTNYDKTHLNSFVAKEVLGFFDVQRDEYICYFNFNAPFSELLELCINKLNLKSKKFIKTKNFINRVGITTGAGGSFIPKVKADAFLSGDIKHHDGLLAKELGLSLIDINHFESEKYFATSLQKELKNLLLKVIITDCFDPFSYN